MENITLEPAVQPFPKQIYLYLLKSECMSFGKPVLFDVIKWDSCS